MQSNDQRGGLERLARSTGKLFLGGVVAVGSLVGLEGCGVGVYSRDPRAGFVLNETLRTVGDIIVAQEGRSQTNINVNNGGNFNRAEERRWRVYNVDVNEANVDSQSGLIIRADIDVYGEPGDGYGVMVYFFDPVKNKALMHKKEVIHTTAGLYSFSNGQVGAIRPTKLISRSNQGYFTNVETFMPYEQLDLLEKGDYPLSIGVGCMNLRTGEKVLSDLVNVTVKKH